MRRVVEETRTDMQPAVAARRRDRFGRREAVVVDDRPGAGAAVAAGAGNGLLMLARVIRFVAGVLATIIIAAILFRVFDANQGNGIVNWFTDTARSLAGPFDGMFTIKNPKTEIAVNWGIAAAVYLIVGGFIAGLIARAGLGAAERGVR
ncbi:MAG: hypothetical protein JWM31_232 [Solirubrobacterales bacterium]|nr:hypothetical protein [Solirubrobacterales bacterium]